MKHKFWLRAALVSAAFAGISSIAAPATGDAPFAPEPIPSRNMICTGYLNAPNPAWTGYYQVSVFGRGAQVLFNGVSYSLSCFTMNLSETPEAPAPVPMGHTVCRERYNPAYVLKINEGYMSVSVATNSGEYFCGYLTSCR